MISPSIPSVGRELPKRKSFRGPALLGVLKARGRGWDWMSVVGREPRRWREDLRNRGATRANPNLGFALVADNQHRGGTFGAERRTPKACAMGEQGGPRTNIRGNIPCKVTSGGHLGSLFHFSLLRSLLAGFRNSQYHRPSNPRCKRPWQQGRQLVIRLFELLGNA